VTELNIGLLRKQGAEAGPDRGFSEIGHG